MKKNLVLSIALIAAFVSGISLDRYLVSDRLVFRDNRDNLYVPMKLVEAKNVCDQKGNLGVQGAGNALDHTSIWPKSAAYVGCWSGNEEEHLLVLDQSSKGPAGTGWNYAENIPTDATVHLVFVDPNRK